MEVTGAEDDENDGKLKSLKMWKSEIVFTKNGITLRELKQSQLNYTVSKGTFILEESKTLTSHYAYEEVELPHCVAEGGRDESRAGKTTSD